MNPRAKAIEAHEQSGFLFKRHGANHDIYFNAKSGCMISLKRHDFDESDLRYIRKEIKSSERARG